MHSGHTTTTNSNNTKTTVGTVTGMSNSCCDVLIPDSTYGPKVAEEEEEE
jgi:hypothetical protein